MIKIEIRLFADLNEFQPENFENFPINEGISVNQLLLNFGIDPNRAKIIFINGKKSSLDDLINNCDRVGVFPPVGGG